MKYILFLILVSVCGWLAYERHDLTKKLEEANQQTLTAKKDTEEADKKLAVVVAEVHRVAPHILPGIGQAVATGQPSKKPPEKSWFQKGLDESASRLNQKPSGSTQGRR